MLKPNCISCVANSVCAMHADINSGECKKVQQKLSVYINNAKIEVLRTSAGPGVKPRCCGCGNPCICGVLT
jgi:hypothetical protein